MDCRLYNTIGNIGRGKSRTENMKQIIIDIGKKKYRNLKILSHNRDVWRTVAHQSNERIMS